MNWIIIALTYVLSTIFAIAGIGAAGVLIPNYVALGLNLYDAVILGLSQNVADLAVVTLLNTRKKLVSLRNVLLVAVPALILIPIGVIVNVSISKVLVIAAFGFFLLFAIYRILAGRSGGSGLSRTRPPILGGLQGFIAGLIGMDAAPIALIAYSYIYRDPKKISANTATVAFMVSTTALTLYYIILAGHGIPVTLSLVDIALIMITGALGGATGALLMHRVKPLYVKYTMLAVLGAALAEITVKLVMTQTLVGTASAVVIAGAVIAIGIVKAIKHRINTAITIKQQTVKTT